ncbi:copper amine oxidase N-terminal domain-containing protein [Bacillus horti]|uniref:Copper amine oxidase-like N-terminal domain-containing protein n=1 Tax=Caldalkalibacillus horti TaxID=77523 RepID=A0ABT9VUF1_9BACI|nr:copper amine oxidase N-terminal domain-containing protein [Bacillus horti]MDQ0164509.1 hypothetical protein [Bacillus horti]
MKKYLSILICAVLIISTSSVTFAHPGRTDANGGHTCRTNCEKWGLEYGEYHYHSGGGSGTRSNSTSSSSSSSSAGSSTTATTKSNPAPVPAGPRYELAHVTVKLDGKNLSFTQDPVTVDGNTLVPMREIFEALGAKIKWDSASETVTGTKGDITVKLTIGQSYATKNGQRLSLSHPAVIVSDKTMVPLRFVSEALGAKVKWDEKTRTVHITNE